MNLSESLEKVDSTLAAGISELSDKWDTTLAADEKEVNALVEQKAKSQAELQEELVGAEAELRKVAEADRKAVIDAFDEKQAQLLAKEQAAANAKLAEQSTEALDAKAMIGMDAVGIAADYKKTEVIAVAKHLGLKSSGNEVDVAQRIVDKLAELKELAKDTADSE